MAINLRRDAWKDDRQFDDVKNLGLEIERGRQIAGQFTPVWAGFSVAPGAGDFKWLRFGDLVLLYQDTGGNIIGTSNTTGLQVTNLPKSITPKASRNTYCVVINSGGQLSGELLVGIGGTLTFGVLDTATIANRVSSNILGFTASGNKGIPSGFLAVYPL